jgi:hypothetical protein
MLVQSCKPDNWHVNTSRGLPTNRKGLLGRQAETGGAIGPPTRHRGCQAGREKEKQIFLVSDPQAISSHMKQFLKWVYAGLFQPLILQYKG